MLYDGSPSFRSEGDRLHEAALLHHAASRGRGRRIAVMGDAILDCYRSADGRSRCFAGGAAVIAAHLRQLGAEPVLITRLGRDGNADQLRGCLADLGVELEAVTSDDPQPIYVRQIDPSGVTALPRSPTLAPPNRKMRGRLAGALAEHRLHLDAVIFADFGHGTVTAELLDDLLPMLRPSVRILAGDVSGPRPSLLAMRRFDLLTPTEHELRRLTPSLHPQPALDDIARRMVQALGLAHLLVTRDHAGSSRFDRDGKVSHQPSRAGPVVDEVGAGDALLAAATLGLAGGLPVEAAVRLGHLAAAAAIAQLGNAPIHWARLHHAAAAQDCAAMRHSA